MQGSRPLIALFALLFLAAPAPGVGQEAYGTVDFTTSCADARQGPRMLSPR